MKTEKDFLVAAYADLPREVISAKVRWVDYYWRLESFWYANGRRQGGEYQLTSDRNPNWEKLIPLAPLAAKGIERLVRFSQAETIKPGERIDCTANETIQGVNHA